MRLITWNCCRGKHDKKLPSLIQLQPDIAVIQETPRPREKLAEYQLWRGTNPNAGILILAFNGWQLTEVQISGEAPELFLPTRVERNGHSHHLLAAWVKPGTRRPHYRSTVDDALAKYEPFIRGASSFVMGDLNTDYRFDDWKELGLVSAYHAFHCKDVGAEEEATLYMYRRRAKRYQHHFDYCFIPNAWSQRIGNVSIGSHDIWAPLSDHMPLIVDIK